MLPEPSTTDVIIVGGGIVGLSSGLELQERGRRVTVVDPGQETQRASFGNAGVLSRGSILAVANPGVWKHLLRYGRNADPAVRLRYRSMASILPWLRHFLGNSSAAAWRSNAAALDPLVAASFDRHQALGRIAGTLPLIRRNGWLRLYRKSISLAAATLEQEILAAHGVATEILDASAIYALEPSLAHRFAQGVLFPQTGSVDSPGEVVRRYEAALLARGATFLREPALGLTPVEGGVEVNTASTRIRAEHAVLSAGAWSVSLVRGLGYRLPLAAERGYHAHFRLAAGAHLNRPINDTAAGSVLSPMGDTVRVLTGIELARPDDPPDFRQLELAVTEAARTLPLGEPVGTPWFGSRPSTPDGLPVIGFAPGQERIVFAFGHGHIGFATGPATGDIVARLICGERPTIPITPFAPGRFARRRVAA